MTTEIREPALNMGTGGTLCARVRDFAAVLQEPEGEVALGRVAGEDQLPKSLRRRMSPFDLGVARCIGGLADKGVDEEIVFASRHGNMSVMTELLMQLATGELLSPARFSMSVHNAAVGAASQLAANRGGHTAIAAGEASLTAGLTEAWLRLNAGSPSVLFVYADLPLSGVYQAFDAEREGGVHLAMRLEPGGGEGVWPVPDVARGRAGAIAVARMLASGDPASRAETLSWPV
jgi:hypothetical protein